MRNIARLRLKESDRVQAVIDNLAVFGINAYEEGGNLFVQGNNSAVRVDNVKVDSFADHRIAMASFYNGCFFKIQSSYLWRTVHSKILS